MKRLIAVCLLIPSICFAWGFGFNFGGGSSGGYVDLLPVLSAWSPSSKAFGNVSTGVIKQQTFTVTNNGNDLAEDVSISVTGTGFSLYSTTTFGNISASRTRTAKVKFSPVAATSYSGFLNYSAPNIARVQAALSGTGTAVGDQAPNAFTFTDQTDVAVSTTITSAAITVAGIDTASAISVTGGTYDINASGTFVSSSGTVSNGNTVRARHTSSASNSTAVNTVVTIGGVSDTFTSTTVAGAACSTGTVNVDHLTALSVDSWGGIAPDNFKGQSFRVASNGTIRSITIQKSADSATGTLRLRWGTALDLTTGAFDDVTVAISGVSPGPVEFVLPSHHAVTTGTDYYFVVTSDAGMTGTPYAESQTTGTYADGVAYYGGIWSGLAQDGSKDLLFQVALCN